MKKIFFGSPYLVFVSNSTIIEPHPNGKKFICAYNGLLDLYELQEINSAIHKKSQYYHFPKISVPGGGVQYIYEKDNIFGFFDAKSDHEYIYLLYCSKTEKEVGREFYSGNQIRIFDWELNPVVLLDLNKEIISMDIDYGKIFGISYDFVALSTFAIPNLEKKQHP